MRRTLANELLRAENTSVVTRSMGRHPLTAIEKSPKHNSRHVVHPHAPFVVVISHHSRLQAKMYLLLNQKLPLMHHSSTTIYTTYPLHIYSHGDPSLLIIACSATKHATSRTVNNTTTAMRHCKVYT